MSSDATSSSDALTTIERVAETDVTQDISPDLSSSVEGSGSSVAGVHQVEADMHNDASVGDISLEISPTVVRTGGSSAGRATSGVGDGSEPTAWLKILVPAIMAIALAWIAGRDGTKGSKSRGGVDDYYYYY